MVAGFKKNPVGRAGALLNLTQAAMVKLASLKGAFRWSSLEPADKIALRNGPNRRWSASRPQADRYCCPSRRPTVASPVVKASKL